MGMPSKVLHRFRTEWRRLKGRGLVDYLRLVKPRLGVWYARNLLRRRVVLGKLHGFKIYLDLDDHGISRTLAVVGTREQDQIAILKRELREGMVVLDIGSNVGSYALLAASLVGESGRVFAVEPAPADVRTAGKDRGPEPPVTHH